MTTQISDEIRVHIRWMIRRDINEVLEIEHFCFEYPWTEEDYLTCLQQRNCIGMVSEYHGKIVGFMVYELTKNRIQLINFATHHEYRRLGVATQMMAKLIGKLSYERRSRITVEVRETNLSAQVFFRSAGFRATQILKDHYEQTQEDAYLMQYRYVPNFKEIEQSHLTNRILQYM